MTHASGRRTPATGEISFEIGGTLCQVALDAQRQIPLYSTPSKASSYHLTSPMAEGFIYCVARKGVTGGETTFSENLSHYLARCREATSLPLAVGFGLSRRSDVDFLKGRADIAVVGSEAIRLMDKDGHASLGPFLRALQEL